VTFAQVHLVTLVMGCILGGFLQKSSGVDVMITIFCDFRPFSAKNWRFSQKPML
jgi:hypothetical protein